ncbi:Thiolase, N-terminal domain-containing protein [Zopfochytrium polystomum]|nr:Thiolase, N-terminal domain-containing protein [Zopfochytrium polystomum]
MLLPQRAYASASGLNSVVIVSAVRTPIGSFGKSLASVPATQLGAVAIRAAIDRAGVTPADVQEVYMGNVISSNIGQAPARQAAIRAGCPHATEATTVNKVCASGLKAVILATQSLQLGTRSVMVAGGMESMSNAPYFVDRGLKYGHSTLHDAIVKDGLTDAYDGVLMGVCAEETASDMKISREEQDAYAIASYTRARDAWAKGLFAAEIAPVTVKGRKGDVTVAVDEEHTNVSFDKIPGLKPAFVKNGTVTAANSSTLNDGASALVLMTAAEASARGLQPLARIVSYADAACAPKQFTIAPSLAIPRALAAANLAGVGDVARFEINEAFAVVALANQRLLGIPDDRLNVLGGGVALGHPIGSSGARILVSLVHQLQKGQIGCAGICNGGGAASALVVERL